MDAGQLLVDQKIFHANSQRRDVEEPFCISLRLLAPLREINNQKLETGNWQLSLQKLSLQQLVHHFLFFITADRDVVVVDANIIAFNAIDLCGGDNI